VSINIEILAPELCIRFLSDYGLVPAGIATELPRKAALHFIHSRRAIPVGDFKVTPDICIGEDELELVFALPETA
jgi:hypothetical protein